MRLAVDTNAYRAFVDGSPAFVEALQKADVVAFSVVVLGELRAGFLGGTRREANELILSRVLSVDRVEIQAITDTTSQVYASLWNTLKKTGRTIPTNDVWIASLCIENDCVLLTRDSHFLSIPNLTLFP